MIIRFDWVMEVISRCNNTEPEDNITLQQTYSCTKGVPVQTQSCK